MWTCNKCGRIFAKANQMHSCRKVPVEFHFKNKEKAQQLFEYLLNTVEKKIGPCQIIPLPCCVHLFGKYDFLAALPKKEYLEIRFALDNKLHNQRIKQTVPLSAKLFKNCLDINDKAEIDTQLLNWLNRSYYLKD